MADDGYRARQPRNPKLVARNVRLMLPPEHWALVDLLCQKNEWTMARVVSYLVKGYMLRFDAIRRAGVSRDAQEMFDEGLREISVR